MRSACLAYCSGSASRSSARNESWRGLRRLMDLGEVAVDLSANRLLSGRIASRPLEQASGDLFDRCATSLRGDPQHIDDRQVLLDPAPELWPMPSFATALVIPEGWISISSAAS